MKSSVIDVIENIISINDTKKFGSVKDIVESPKITNVAICAAKLYFTTDTILITADTTLYSTDMA